MYTKIILQRRFTEYGAKCALEFCKPKTIFMFIDKYTDCLVVQPLRLYGYHTAMCALNAPLHMWLQLDSLDVHKEIYQLHSIKFIYKTQISA